MGILLIHDFVMICNKCGGTARIEHTWDEDYEGEGTYDLYWLKCAICGNTEDINNANEIDEEV